MGMVIAVGHLVFVVAAGIVKSWHVSMHDIH